MDAMTQLQTLYAAAGRTIARFRSDTRGATSIEYAMIAAGIGAFIAATVMGLGTSIKETFYDKLANLLS
jgi:pilus assembly protein Flp/PilA